MAELYPWFGDLYKVETLSRASIGVLIILGSVLCGALVGMERERRDKPAGMRTVILICVGSTIVTMTGTSFRGRRTWPIRHASRPRSLQASDSWVREPSSSCGEACWG